MHISAPPVAPAHGPAIHDRQLAQLTRIAYDAPQSLCTEAECEWLLSHAAPLLEELRRWRAFGAANHVPAQALNVITLPVAR